MSLNELSCNREMFRKHFVPDNSIRVIHVTFCKSDVNTKN